MLVMNKCHGQVQNTWVGSKGTVVDYFRYGVLYLECFPSIKVPLVEQIMQHTVNVQCIAWKIGHPALVVWPSLHLALLRCPLPSHPLTVHLLAFLCLVGAEEGVEAV